MKDDFIHFIDQFFKGFLFIERTMRLILVAVLILEVVQMQFTMHDQTATIASLTEVLKTIPCVK